MPLTPSRSACNGTRPYYTAFMSRLSKTWCTFAKTAATQHGKSLLAFKPQRQISPSPIVQLRMRTQLSHLARGRPAVRSNTVAHLSAVAASSSLLISSTCRHLHSTTERTSGSNGRPACLQKIRTKIVPCSIDMVLDGKGTRGPDLLRRQTTAHQKRAAHGPDPA